VSEDAGIVPRTVTEVTHRAIPYLLKGQNREMALWQFYPILDGKQGFKTCSGFYFSKKIDHIERIIRERQVFNN
jgi:hypothetical protein